MMKKNIFAVICLIIVIGLCGCTNVHTNKDSSMERNYQGDIEAIYFSHGAVFGQYGDTPAYKIDLRNGAFYETAEGIESDNREWGTPANDADFVFVSNLDDDAIDNFFRQTARHGMTKWKPSYRDDTVMDGSVWHIKIIFSDQEPMESYGLNEYPSTWEKVMEDFEALTGRDF